MKGVLKLNSTLRQLVIIVFLTTSYLTVGAQEKHTGAGTGGTTHAEQADSYRRSFEESSGYDVPHGGLISQPWVWCLFAAGMVLLIGFIYKERTDHKL